MWEPFSELFGSEIKGTPLKNMKDPWTERKCSSKVDHMLEPCVGAIGEPREHHAPMQSWVNVNPSRLHVLHIALFGKLRGEVEAGVC